MIKLLVRLSLGAPRLTLAVIGTLTLVLGFYARTIQVDSSIVNLLPMDDPDRAYHERMTSIFGGEEVVVVAVMADDVFTPATLAKIDHLSRELAALDGVREVISPSTVKGIEVRDFGLSTGPVMETVPATVAEAKTLRERMLANPLYVGNVVSADGRTAGVSVFFEPGVTEMALRGIDDRIREIARGYEGPEQIAITGIPTIKVGGARLMETDIGRFMPLSVLLVTLVLLWAFRTMRGVVVALFPVLVGMVWTTGTMVLLGSAINMGTLVLTPLLLSIGVAYSIHIMSQYYEELDRGRSSRDAIAAAMEHVRLPLGVAALTTVCGFATFVPAAINAIREFGMYSVLGITLIVVACVTVIPATLSLMPAPAKARAERRQSRILTTVLAFVGRNAVAYRHAVLVMVVLICLVSIDGIRRLRIETDYLGFFSASSTIRKENALVSEKLSGTQPLYVIVEGNRPGSVTRLDALESIAKLQAFIASHDKVDKTMSIVDYLALVRASIEGDTAKQEAGTLPTTQQEIDQLLMLIDPADIRGFVDPKLEHANVVVRTRLSGSQEVKGFAADVREWAAANLSGGLHARPIGTLLLLAQSADNLAKAQIVGLGEILITLLVLMAMLFLSLRVAALSLIPNVVPIILLFAMMGWLGIELNISTSLIAALAIGLAIDDTIHFLTTFNSELHRTGDQEQATLRVMKAVGHPIVFTSIALGLGFLLVTLSNFKPVQNFGLLASATMIFALFADLILLPALVTTTRIITLWDLLFLKLGDEPHKQIPLFRGLRPFHARIVVLMGHLAEAAAGEHLTRRGELKEELYVLLGGRAEVWRGERLIRTLGRGDVIGEMGLVRGEPRSADVIVAESLEYVVLDRTFLRRIKRRYPWIAATVFLNMAQILSERLELTTDELAHELDAVEA